MARRHAVKAEEVTVVVAGVVGSGQGESVGKRADVEAWRSLEPSKEARRHRKQRPHTPFKREAGPLVRLVHQHIPT